MDSIFVQTMLAAIADVFAILASSIAIYIFVSKRKQLSSLLSTLLNYSYQLTLSELKEKLERLNEFHVDDEEGRKRIEILVHEIIGQIEGNPKLRSVMSEVRAQAETLVSDKKKLTEPKKRAFVAELRERIRHLNIQSIDRFPDGVE